jgi:hypothetical protein
LGVIRVRVKVKVRVRVRVASAALASKGIYWGENQSKRKEETRREVSG